MGRQSWRADSENIGSDGDKWRDLELGERDERCGVALNRGEESSLAQ